MQLVVVPDDTAEDRYGALGRALRADRHADRSLDAPECRGRDAARLEAFEHLLAFRAARDRPDPSYEPLRAVEENLGIDVVRVAEQKDVAVLDEGRVREERLGPCHEAAPRVWEALRG